MPGRICGPFPDVAAAFAAVVAAAVAAAAAAAAAAVGGGGHYGWAGWGRWCYGESCCGRGMDDGYGRCGSDLLGGDNAGGGSAGGHGAGGRHGHSTRTLLSGDSRCPTTHQSPPGLFPATLPQRSPW